ncbi:MAG: HNH endonuclease [Moraxellaceae bacterium]
MQQKYEPVGACIFCRESINSGQLTNEHIIAYSLGGVDELPKATCEDHQKITARLDEQVACNMLGIFRHANGLPSRTKTDLQPHYKIAVTNKKSGVTSLIKVPISEVPGLYISPHLIIPGIMVGAPALPFRVGHILKGFLDDKLEKLMRKLPSGATITRTTGDFNQEVFAAMLSKVAHTFTTAEVGHGNFKPVLLDIIDGNFANPFHYVGGFEPSAPQEQSPLSLRKEAIAGNCYWIVSISLKSLPAMPRFQVVAGQVIDPAPFPERSRTAQDSAREAIKDARLLKAKEQGLYGKQKTKRPR